MANKRSHIHGISNNPNAYYHLARLLSHLGLRPTAN